MVHNAHAIAQIAAIVGAIYAFVPRSLSWQLKLVGVRSVILGCSASVNAVLLGSLDPFRVLLLYWSAPFLLTFAATHLIARAASAQSSRCTPTARWTDATRTRAWSSLVGRAAWLPTSPAEHDLVASLTYTLTRSATPTRVDRMYEVVHIDERPTAEGQLDPASEARSSRHAGGLASTHAGTYPSLVDAEAAGAAASHSRPGDAAPLSLSSSLLCSRDVDRDESSSYYSDKVEDSYGWSSASGETHRAGKGHFGGS